MRALVLVVVLAGCHDWTWRDTALTGAFVTATAMDWHQTDHITSMCRESNPVVGPCGGGFPPAAYFPFVILGATAVAIALPPGWRAAFLGVLIGIEASA